jgi:DNA invertase Pin-like site-specific DNA recombinase
MSLPKPTAKRCAIYTRKSSEEGLEQDFNSLHAQREACEAFIKSQRSEGWRLIATAYDDGGLSGGTLERLSLQRLLSDIANGQVDTVVVYKVDRLTRSLADFAKLVELFDRHGVSFVAVTQQFNTTTSMGRLTLNILLSFAQFEREVTGERIRDKIAASKRRGMWMGGNLPLGYDVRERKLVINPAEAETVRSIYRLYRELGCVRRLQEDLDRRGIRSKVRLSEEGNRSGGCSFSRGALYTLLANPVYIGEIRHKSLRHPGQHDPILDRGVWEAVQKQLRMRAPDRKAGQGKEPSSYLIGKLFDEAGERLTPSHTVKGGRRYRYYVSRPLVTGRASRAPQGWRLPALEIERIVLGEVAKVLGDPGTITAALREVGVDTRRVPAALDEADGLRRKLQSELERGPVLASLVERAELRQDAIGLTVTLAPVIEADDATPRAAGALRIVRTVPLRIRRRGVEMRLIIDSPGTKPVQIDPVLLKTIARAHRWFKALANRQATSVAELARREGVNDRYIRSLIHLAFLAPRVVEAIVEGHQPADLTAKSLATRIDLPLEWQDQMQALGIR